MPASARTLQHVGTDDPARVNPARFLAWTLVLSWALWVPLMLMRLDVLPRPVSAQALTGLALPGVLVPSLVAAALCRQQGRSTLRTLGSSVTRWRVGPLWWPALAVQPLVLAVVAASWVGPAVVSPKTGLTLVSVVVSLTFLVLAALGEEVGWRGVALPALATRHGVHRATVALGLVVATWHLPYWVLQGVLEEHGLGYLVLDYLFVLALTYQLTWLFLRSGSVLVAVGLHVSFNAVNVVFLPVTSSAGAFAVLVVVEAALAALAAYALTRGAGPENAATTAVR